MRVAFLGNAPWSVQSLKALASSSHHIELVVTRTPKPAGRGGRLRPTPVAEHARTAGLMPLLEVPTVKSGRGFDALSHAAVEVLVVVAYGEILPPAVLELPTVAPINVHFSLLPQLRGAAPVQWAILRGLDVTGVTTIRMDAGMDTGPVLLQAEEPIRPDDDAGSLGGRLAGLGGTVLVRTLDALSSGTVRQRPQDDATATYAPKLDAADAIIDWKLDAAGIVRLVRAMAPEPGASTTFRGRRLKILRAREPEVAEGEVRPEGRLAPGRVLAAAREALIVAAGAGSVRIDEVTPEGGRRMTGGEFVRGYHPEPGETLGS